MPLTELTAYCLKLKSHVNIMNPELHTGANGTTMVKGEAEGHPGVKVSRIIGKADVPTAEKLIAAAGGGKAKAKK